MSLDKNDAIVGDANGICESAEMLNVFAHGCDQIACTGPCCHPECCGDGGDTYASEQCFSTLLSASLQVKDDEELHEFQVGRTYSAFSPSIILND